jgi:hypothetical protein
LWNNNWLQWRTWKFRRFNASESTSLMRSGNDSWTRLHWSQIWEMPSSLFPRFPAQIHLFLCSIFSLSLFPIVPIKTFDCTRSSIVQSSSNLLRYSYVVPYSWIYGIIAAVRLRIPGQFETNFRLN